MKWRFAFFLLPPPKMSAYDFDHFFGIPKNVTVLESNHFDTVVIQILLSLPISLFGFVVEVNVAVKLYRQSLGGTVEIQNVWSGTMLSSKLSAVHLRRFDESPEGSFSRSHILPESRTESGQFWKIIDVGIASPWCHSNEFYDKPSIFTESSEGTYENSPPS